MKKTKNKAAVTILDRNENMLKEGKRRSNAGQIDKGLEWVCGDAMKLPFEKEAFDYYTISFGIRNVLDLKRCLSEAFRVLKPGGSLYFEINPKYLELLNLNFSDVTFGKIEVRNDIFGKSR